MRLKSVLVALSALILVSAAPAYPAEVDWSKAGASQLTLFYPGVTSWEFLTSDDHRLGGREIKNAKKDCRHCHLSKEGELDLKADEIASGSVKMKRSHNSFEPEPLPNKKGTMQAEVKAAYDNDYLYIRVVWNSKGAGWQKKNNNIPDRVSLQVNKAELNFSKYGCFITCHNDLNTMPEAPSKKDVASNAYYRGLDRNDVRLYAFYTRSSWNERKGEKELEKKFKSGGLIDLWSIEFDGGRATPLNGWVFDDRVWEEKPGNVEGTGSWANGKYTATFKVRLKSKDRHDISINEGDVISAGMAIHDEGTAKRKHYVSFPFSIGLGTAADIKAEKKAN